MRRSTSRMNLRDRILLRLAAYRDVLLASDACITQQIRIARLCQTKRRRETKGLSLHVKKFSRKANQ